MFIVFNKQKIYSYLVSFATVVILFIFAFATLINNNDTVLTASQSRELPIYCVDTVEKKVALTINCAWNADDIDIILKTLEENQVKLLFSL